MVYNIFRYRRPARVVDGLDTARRSEDGNSLSAGGSSHSNAPGIPDALSFEKIVSGGTCPPVTCRDFMKYLQYVEHCAENLQFFLWLRDYSARFEQLPPREKVLSPPWSDGRGSCSEPAPARSVPPPLQQPAAAPRRDRAVDRVFADAFDGRGVVAVVPLESAHVLSRGVTVRKVGVAVDPFYTPPGSAGKEEEEEEEEEEREEEEEEEEEKTPATSVGCVAPFLGASPGAGSIASSMPDHRKVTAEAFEAACVLEPFTIQPFRAEVSRIISVYLAEGAPRELNLSARERHGVLAALARTTHPSAFARALAAADAALRLQSHARFVRWSIRNAGRPRVAFARALGAALVLAAVAAAVLLPLARCPRASRLLAALPGALGLATLLAARSGLCVVLHGLHRRQLRPWELWADLQSDTEAGAESADSKDSFDSLVSNASHEDEPWARKYEQRSLLRKIFDREVFIDDPALRRIQDTIALRSALVAVLAAAVLAAVLVALPPGNLY